MKCEDITKNARIKKGDWDVLSKSKGTYVEVGTHYGASACAAAQSAKKVYTIDIYDWSPKHWEGKPEAKKITFFKGTSADFIKKYKRKTRYIDVLFIDGSHEADGVRIDCESLIPFVKKGGLVLFHDHNPCNAHTGVFEAANKYLDTIKHTKLPKKEETGHLLQVIIEE